MYEPPVLIVFVVINILHFGLYIVFTFFKGVALQMVT